MAHLLTENRLSLTTETSLFSVVTPPTLRRVTFLRLLVLGYFVGFVHFALLAESAPYFRHVHLKNKTQYLNISFINLHLKKVQKWATALTNTFTDYYNSINNTLCKIRFGEYLEKLVLKSSTKKNEKVNK